MPVDRLKKKMFTGEYSVETGALIISDTREKVMSFLLNINWLGEKKET